jgi:hypothetical protein
MTPVLGIIAALLTLACAAFLVRSDAVSADGAGGYRRYYRWQTAALAYAALVVAAAVARTTIPVPQLIVYLLLTFAAGRLLIPSFPTDVDRNRPTTDGRIHILLAVAAFASIAWCAAEFPDRVDLGNLHGTLVVLGWIVVVTAAACGLASLLRRITAPYFRAIERLFYAALLTWFLVVSLSFF